MLVILPGHWHNGACTYGKQNARHPTMVQAVLQALARLVQALLQAPLRLMQALLQALPKIGASIITCTPQDWCKHYYRHSPRLVQALLQVPPKIGASIIAATTNIGASIITTTPKIGTSIIIGIFTGLKTFEKMQAKTRNTPLEFNAELGFEPRTPHTGNLHTTTWI